MSWEPANDRMRMILVNTRGIVMGRTTFSDADAQRGLNSSATAYISWSSGQVTAWIVLLFALTLVGALPLLSQRINLTQISNSTRFLPVVMMGMLVTSCSPTLAALLVAGLYPGAGGVRSISRQMRVWRVPAMWYTLALIGPIILLLVAEGLAALHRGTSPAHWMVLPSFFGPGGLYFVIFGSLLPKNWAGADSRNLDCKSGWARCPPALSSDSSRAPGTSGV